MKILHVTVHMGGGIGRALSDLLTEDARNEHKVVILQQPVKLEFIRKCQEQQLIILPSVDAVRKLLEWSDVVIIHWWHNPVMCKFLYDFPDTSCRLVVWSHVSGCTYPFLNPKLIEISDRTIMTSPYTLDNRYWSEEEQEWIKEKTTLVYGQGKMSNFETKKTYATGRTFRIGYIGTLNKSKLNNQFVEACSRVIKKRSNVSFVMVGDTTESQWIIDDIKKRCLTDHFDFIGYSTNINELLLSFDIFGYPLNPYNFATTENSILEAMSVGLPVVLLNQGTEKYIVEDGKNGLLADDMWDYSEKLIELIDSMEFRKKLGENAIEYISENYNYNNNLYRFYSVIDEVSKLEKKPRSLKNIIGQTPYEWFMFAVNSDDRKIINSENLDSLESIYKEKSKSSIPHFASIYPNDFKLNQLNSLIFGKGKND